MSKKTPAGPPEGPAPHDDTKTAAVLRRLEGLRAKIETNGPALLQAIALAARHGVAMPSWMADAYLARFKRLQRLEVGSLDEAFGPLPFKPGKALATLRQRHARIPKVSSALLDALNANPERAINRSLFEEIAEQLGIGSHSTVYDLYREGIARHGLPDLAEMKKLRLFPFK